MSVAELKRAVDGLSPDERLELADYLRRRAKQDDPQWEAELGKRLEEAASLQARLAAKDLWKSEAGHRYTPEELKRMSQVADVKIHRRKRVAMRLA
jgi:hypothetical protein